MIDKLKDLLNQNQGVISAIPVIGWFISLFTGKKGERATKNSQAIIQIGSHNYVEGQSIEVETEIETVGGEISKGQDKSVNIVAKITASKNKIQDECFLLDCFGKQFALSRKDLYDVLSKCTKEEREFKLSTAQLVKIFRKFYPFNSNDLSISYNHNFFTELEQELVLRSIVLEIRTMEEELLETPWQKLSGENFGDKANNFSIYLKKDI